MSWRYGKKFGHAAPRRGDVLATINKTAGIPASILKKMKRLSPIALLHLAQKRNASGKDINKLRHGFSTGALQVGGMNDYNTKYLYDEGNNIMNHMNFGNKKTRTVKEEHKKFYQLELGA